jgi:aspartyl protease family protein
MSRDLLRGLKITTVWLVLGTLVFLGVQAYLERQQRTRFVAEGGRIEISRSPDGHHHWLALMNSQAVDSLVDTGATSTALPAALADELGLVLSGSVPSMTACGPVTGRLVMVDRPVASPARAGSTRPPRSASRSSSRARATMSSCTACPPTRPWVGSTTRCSIPSCMPLLNSEWVNMEVFELAAGVKGGRSPAQRTLDAGCQLVRWPSWPMRHADALAMTSRSVSHA